ncbi:hypothetical protein THRCLA_03285 [Thraustotheca clavata]|uniref:Uncharacterized protein n=1 Tax=Thraustotheca clavata TaxID=74557 RepID=A0A1W0A2I3_9STRA|nr:hypothetical protein THRCLA_03285 [Thraustotheca clavata]
MMAHLPPMQSLLQSTSRRSNSIEALLSPMEDDDDSSCSESCNNGVLTSPEADTPPTSPFSNAHGRSSKAIMARLKTGQDVCVVINNGTVDWWTSYMNYGFDSNSIFRTIVPTRPTTTSWTQQELNYVQAIQRCIKDNHVRVPYGRCTAAFIAERLHTTRERVHRYLKLVPYPSSKNCSSDEALQELKELKVLFLSTLQSEVVGVMQAVRLDQSWIVAIKY